MAMNHTSPADELEVETEKAWYYPTYGNLYRPCTKGQGPTRVTRLKLFMQNRALLSKVHAIFARVDQQVRSVQLDNFDRAE